MISTYSNGKKIYSIDLMFSYINIFKPKYKSIVITKLLHMLNEKCWGNEYNKDKRYSPLDVIKDKKNKKYKNEINRIKNSNLKYPIIITDKNDVVDGMHRLAKAFLQNKKNIKVYFFDKKLMKKFLINSKGNYEKIDKLQGYELIEIFYKKFKSHFAIIK